MTTRTSRPRAAADRAIPVGTPDVVERLARLRELLPEMARDLATARRHANALRAENENLQRRVAELETTLGALTNAGRTRAG